MQTDTENMRDFVSIQQNLKKWKLSPSAYSKLNCSENLLLKNGRFQYSGSKINSNKCLKGFYHWNYKFRGSKRILKALDL